MTPVRGVLPEEIPTIWPRILPLVKKALVYEDRSYRPKDIAGELLSGAKQLVMSDEPLCVLISELLDYPNGVRSCNIFLTAGKFPPDWKDILSGLEQWARSKGCISIEMKSPRKGWARRLPDWKAVTTIYRKEL